jgi:NAD+ synthase
VDFIRNLLKTSGATGIVYGNSGGKDSALVGILCKMACANTLGIQLPCGSKRNFNEDLDDAAEVARQFSIETKMIDLSAIKDLFINTINEDIDLNQTAITNIAPRLRMMTLYSVAATESRLVAGTGNKSEGYMGYFTKWGDGACDFNVIADLTVTEIYDFLKFLNAPENIIQKAPSAGLFDNQTDESEMGITYAKIDDYILNGHVNDEDYMLIERFHKNSEHKRQMPIAYKE